MGIGMLELLIIVVVGGALALGGLAGIGLLIYFLLNKQKPSHADMHAKDLKG